MGHSPHSLHILCIPIIKEWGKAVLRTDRHISQFVDLPAVPLYFGLSFFCRTADISKCLFQYDHLLSWPDRFPLPGVFPKRNTHKAFRSVDVLWTSGFFSSLFQMSARHPATVVLCFPLLPQLPVQCGHGRFPAYNTHRSLQCRLPETPTLPPQGW